MKTALITGITGQDGSYLTELLVSRGYIVHGIIRRHSTILGTSRIDHLYNNPEVGGKTLFLHYGDLTDGSSMRRIIEKTQPDEIYHLAAQSHVRVSFDIPEYTADTTALGTCRLLEAIRDVNIKIKYYQASSSEMYGKVMEIPQRETTPFYPRSPYACAKVYSYHLVRNYRDSYGMFACNGILFNHESPRRGETFVTRKITLGLANILAGKQKKLVMGNLDAKRDWGFAGDYVEAMYLMLQAKESDDYVVATGETYSVRDFLEASFAYKNLKWQDYVEIDERYFRPAEVDLLIGDASKAQEKLGWKPKTMFKDLVKMMVDSDIALISGAVNK